MNLDNSLATDFNQPDPTTYKPTTEKESVSVCLQSDYQRPNCPPKATYVKAPQVPSDFINKKPPSNQNTVLTPPLPFTPSLPNLSNSSLGIPYLPQSGIGNNFKQSNHFLYKIQSSNSHGNIFSSANMSGGVFISPSTNNTLVQSNMAYTAFTSSNALHDNRRKNFPFKILTPPLPNVSNNVTLPTTADLLFPMKINHSDMSITPNLSTESYDPASTMNKKQPKVKFSDTVTAFIVPEIKRPQRPAPPSHVTDSQKELADSLPLCHPNEDYLKDFTPVRKNDNSEESDDPPKIKVVHFGVV